MIDFPIELFKFLRNVRKDNGIKIINDKKGTLGREKTADFNIPAKQPVYSKLDFIKVEKLLGEEIPSWHSGIDRFIEEMKENCKKT